MVKEQGLLFVCMIHLCFADEIFEAVSINTIPYQTYALSDFEIDTPRINFQVPCCDTFSISFTGPVNGSLSKTLLEVCPDSKCAISGQEYIKLNGDIIFDQNINCRTPDMLWINKSSSGVIVFGIPRVNLFQVIPPYDQIDSVDIEVASDACTSWTFEKMVCSNGTHGYSCDLLCGHCLGLACDRYTGDCPNGCELHWDGINCTEFIPEYSPTTLIERTDTTNGYFKKESGIQLTTLNRIGSSTQCTELRCALSCLMHSWCWYYHFDSSQISCQECVLCDSTVQSWLESGQVDEHLYKWVSK